MHTRKPAIMNQLTQPKSNVCTNPVHSHQCNHKNTVSAQELTLRGISFGMNTFADLIPSQRSTLLQLESDPGTPRAP